MATLKERLQADLTAAIRARDDITKGTLRMALAAVTRAEVAGREQTTLTDDQVLAVIRSEVKKRAEAAEIYDGAGRAESAERERAEGAVLAAYLPAELDDEALAAVVAEEVGRARDAGTVAVGPVIKAVRERVGAQAQGARIAEAVRAALAG